MMARALRAAERGRGRVEPNPLVGAVLTQGAKVLAVGWHRRFGGPHAEIEALRRAGRGAKGSTLYVTLEPCAHYGKTPPCADAVIQAGVRRVVAAMRDPFAEVAGRGLRKLRRAGLVVETGLLADQAEHLNLPYLKRLRHKLPFITLKWAMTADGRIAVPNGDSKWVTGPLARKRVHRMRDRANAVLVGLGTVLADDPELTVRHVRGRNPLRVVVDSRGRTPVEARLVRTAGRVPTLIATTERASKKWEQTLADKGVEIIRLPAKGGRVDLRRLMRELSRRGVCTVLVEGGARLAGALVKERLADRIAAFIAPKLCLDGLSPLLSAGVTRMSRSIRLDHLTCRKVGDDLLVEADIL